MTNNNLKVSDNKDIESLELAEIIDSSGIQRLMDDFFKLTNIGVAFLDLRGNVLVTTGCPDIPEKARHPGVFQVSTPSMDDIPENPRHPGAFRVSTPSMDDIPEKARHPGAFRVSTPSMDDICSKFRCIHPETSKYCTQIDVDLSIGTDPGTFTSYQCKNNIRYIVTPIMIGEKHVGNLFLGQFLFDDDPEELELLREQARSSGFDEEQYIAAYKSIPRWSREKVNTVMNFYTKLAQMISSLSYSNLMLAKSTEESRKLAESMEHLIEGSPDGIIVIAPDGTIERINSAANKIFEGRLLAGKISDFSFSDAASTDITISRKDGANSFLEMHKCEIAWNGDRATMITLRDITEQKRAEMKRENLQEQVIQSHKMEAIGRLAGCVAHDFNNMLGIILGYGDNLLEELNPTDPLQECVAEIVNAGKRSAALTRQLLAFSRKQTMKLGLVDINNILRNLEKMLRKIIGEDIEFVTTLAEGLSNVEVDLGQMEQVIMNIVLNAKDAMPKGGKLTIETANVELDKQYARDNFDVIPGQFVMTAISDTGCGMDNDTKTRIFEPFFTTKEKGKGTGLGLSTVYGIVKQLQGYISVHSELKKGTTFKVYLPQASAKPPLKDVRTEKYEINQSGENILVVEDDPALQKLCARMLKGLKYNVTTVTNGSEALILMKEKEFRPDLLLTDVVLPGMGGCVLADRLRKIHPDLKVLYMSGYLDNMLVEHGVSDAESQFIQKPFNIDDLSKKIRLILRGK